MLLGVFPASSSCFCSTLRFNSFFPEMPLALGRTVENYLTQNPAIAQEAIPHQYSLRGKGFLRNTTVGLREGDSCWVYYLSVTTIKSKCCLNPHITHKALKWERYMTPLIPFLLCMWNFFLVEFCCKYFFQCVWGGLILGISQESGNYKVLERYHHYLFKYHNPSAILVTFLGVLLTGFVYLEENYMPDTGQHSGDKVTCCCLVHDLGFSSCCPWASIWIP